MISRARLASPARTVLAISLLAMPAVAIAATYVVWTPVLDGNLAFHWDVSGRVDGVIAAMPVFVTSLAIATVAAVVGALLLLVPHLSSAAQRDAATAPTAALHHSELTRWSTTVVSPLIAGVGIVAVASIPVATFLDSSDDGWVGVAVGVSVVIVFLLVGALAAIHVSIDSRGLTIRSALVRIPFMIIPLASIRAVRVDTVRATDWGGWGWRRRGSDTGYIMRGSSALAVERANGTTVFVTLPDPSEPASVLQTLARRTT